MRVSRTKDRHTYKPTHRHADGNTSYPYLGFVHCRTSFFSVSVRGDSLKYHTVTGASPVGRPSPAADHGQSLVSWTAHRRSDWSNPIAFQSRYLSEISSCTRRRACRVARHSTLLVIITLTIPCMHVPLKLSRIHCTVYFINCCSPATRAGALSEAAVRPSVSLSVSCPSSKRCILALWLDH